MIALAVALVLDLGTSWSLRRFLGLPGWTMRGLIWITVGVGMLSLYPRTDPVAVWLTGHVLAPIWLFLLMVAVGFALVGSSRKALRFYFASLEREWESRPQPPARWRQRLLMYEQVARIAVALGIILGCLMFYFSLLQVNVGGILAGAGFIGVGMGLAAQDLLKDWLAGLMIVMEDQFGVGDRIRSAGFEGTVEAFTLRITQLRDREGALITIPNSTLRPVSNLLTSEASVEVRVPVDPAANLRRALQRAGEAGRQLQEEWPDRLAEPPAVLGLEPIGESALGVRMTAKTTHAFQEQVRGELLLRVVEALRKEG